MSFKTFLTESPGDAGDMVVKLDYLNSQNEKLKMIYQWVKTGHCTAGQFMHLIAHVTSK